MGYAEDLAEALSGDWEKGLVKGLEDLVKKFQGYLKQFAKYEGRVSVGKVETDAFAHGFSTSVRVNGDGWYLVLSSHASHGGEPTYKLALMDEGRRTYLEGMSGVKFPSFKMNAELRQIVEIIARRF